MKRAHKKHAYKLLNIGLCFALLFQSSYPFFYTTKAYAQTPDLTEESAVVQETTPSAQPVPAEVLQEPVADSVGSVESTGETLVEPPASEPLPTVETGEPPASSSDSRPQLVPSAVSREAGDGQQEASSSVGSKSRTSSESLKDLRSNYARGKADKDYVEGEVLVKFKEKEINLNKTSGKSEVSSFAKAKDLEKVRDIKLSNTSLLRIKDDKSTAEKIKELKSDKRVEYVEPNYLRYPATIDTNDTNKQLLWGLDNTGQSVNGSAGTSDADIDAPEAWVQNAGTSAVVVAIIDDGVAYNHPDLINNMWDGSSCKDENGNALGSCLHGYDFEDLDKDPSPANGSHGTHIAGVIAATRNNNAGVLGVTPNAKIMALKYGFTVASEISAIDFAIQNGAKVINASFAGPNYSQAEYDAINRFNVYGGVFVTAAGNETTNNESTHSYPSDYTLSNIISVAATDQHDALASYSNFGSISVDVGAPGTNIYSTVTTSSTLLNQSFESITPPAIPGGWEKGGASNNWGTYSLLDPWGNVLHGDLAYPYANNRNTYITSPTFNLSSGGANLDFWAACDTEYKSDGWYDYMQLEYSADGSNFSPASDPYYGGEFRWDENYLDFLDDDSSQSGSAVYHFENLSIPSQYSTSNFKLRFRWVSNSSDNNYDGCLVDDIQIVKYGDGSGGNYDYKDGTSMATPYVAGLASLLWSVDSTLSTDQVRTAILTTGDSLPSLAGKTSTGKRINAYNAVRSVDSSNEITSFSFTSPSVTGVVDEVSHTVSLQVPYGTNVTSLTPTIIIDGASISPASGIPQNFTSPVSYTVTAANGSTQVYIVTVNVTAPSTVATVSSSTYTVDTSTITNVPFGTTKANFLGNLVKGDTNQSWNDTGISSTVVTGNTLEVTAQDGTTKVVYTITVDQVVPVLDHIGNKTVDELTLLAFTVTATDPDGPSKLFSLTDAPTGASINSSTGAFTFTPAEDQGPQVYTLTISVSDGTNADSEEITITVNEVNSAPVSRDLATSTDEDNLKTIILDATDTDLPVQSLTYSIASNPSHGVLGTLTGNQLSYTPSPNYNGPDSFTYKANDGISDGNISTVSITVAPVNDVPVVVDGGVTTDEDNPVTITLSGSDVDGDALTYTAVSVPSNGVLSVISGNQVTYTPNADYAGDDSFTFKANDGTTDSNTATVSITVNAVNDHPVLATIGNQSVNELANLSFTAGAVDPDDSLLTYSLTNAPAGASIDSSTGVFSFTPTEIQGPGSYTLTINVTDGVNTDFEEITITVNEVNIEPTADDISVSTNEDTAKTITLNASDADLPANALVYTVVSGPSNGVLGGMSADHEVSYTPNANYAGSDIFTYKVNDGNVDSNHATVTITVVSVNDAPTANNGTASTDEDTAVTFSLTGSDPEEDTLSYSVNTNPSHGSVSITGDRATYTPNSGFNGTDTFTFTVSDGLLDSTPATVTLTVTGVNDAPVITPIGDQSVDEYSTLTITPIVTDADSTVFTFSLINSPTVPNSSIDANTGVFTFTPDETQGGNNYYFDIKVDDGDTVNNVATESFNVTVNEINNRPIATDDVTAMDEDTTAVISHSSLLVNDTDPDNVVEDFSITSVANPSPTGSTVAINGSNIEFTTPNNFNGTASFDYTMTDGNLTDVATVSVTVNPVNDAPVAQNDVNSLDEDTALTISKSALLANDTDVDGNPLAISEVSNPINGAVSIDGDNVVFTPNSNYFGSASFDYTVTDGELTDTATVTLTVNPVNDAPVLESIGNKTVDELATLAFTATATDVEAGDTLTFSLTDKPAGATINPATGEFSFTPTESQGPGSYTMGVNVTDGTDTVSETIIITVNEVNVAPVVNDVNATTAEDAEKIVTLSASDTDTPAQTFTYAKVSDPSHGSVSITGDQVTYTPGSNFFGSDSFTYKANDGLADSNIATVYITISSVNDAPVANPDTASVNEDETLTIAKTDLLLNDTDVDDSSLIIYSVSNPAHGVVSIVGNNIVFTPDSNYFGLASFDYTVSDGSLTNTTTVSVTVNPVNDAPSATDGAATTSEDTSVTINLSGNDVDGDDLSYTVVSDPSNGTLGNISGNQVTYTPNQNYFGSDSFIFKTNDGSLDSNTATINITVTAVNDPPVLDAIGNKTIDELAVLTFKVNATDVDAGSSLTYSLTNAPSGATIGATSGDFSFTPTETQGPGSYTLTVNVTDGVATDSEEVTITVNEVNIPPTTEGISISANEDTAKLITLDATDTDLPANSLAYTIVAGVSHGVLGSISGNQLTYTPSLNYNGSDSFTYKVNDGSADSNISTVTITVLPVNDAPVANTNTATTDEDTVLTIAKSDLIANDTDVDLDTLTLTAVANPIHGAVYISGGNVVFTPSLNYNGIASFDYTVSDGELTSSTTASVTVSPVNDAPIVNDGSFTTTQEASVLINLSGSDVDGNSLTYTIVSSPANGALSEITGNQLTYTPSLAYVGADSFTFKANDGSVDSNIATTSITVTPPPVITNETAANPGRTEITITWTTDHLSTSRVIYDTVSHSTLGIAPNYGYTSSTAETDTSPKVLSHSVTITGLSAETTYYYRVISHGSPEVVGDEKSFTTADAEEVDTEAPDRPENASASYNAESQTIKLTWDNNDSGIDKVYAYLGFSKDFDKNSDSRIAENNKDDKDVTVNNVEKGKTYYFKLVSEDKAGNRSSTKTISIDTPSVQGATAVVNTYEDTNTLGSSVVETESGEEKESVLGKESTPEVKPAMGVDTAAVKEANDSNIWKFIIPSAVLILIGAGLILKRKRT